MIANVGSTDRALRLALGAVLILAALFSGWSVFDGVALKYGAVIVGIVLLATAMVRFCPLYRMLGVKTCRS